MKQLLTIGLILAALLVSTSFMPLVGLNGTQEASAYYREPCRWTSSTIYWRAMSNLTSTDLADSKLAIAGWNDAPVSLFFDQVTSGENIQLYSGYRPDLPDTQGFTIIACNTSTQRFVGVGWVTINDYLTNGLTSQHRQSVIAHEMGHTLGLDENSNPSSTNDEKTLMYPDDLSYSLYKVFVPVLDDIRGAQVWYGGRTSNSQCPPNYNQNGVVEYNPDTPTCSSSNPDLPMTERVTTAGAGNRAFASQYSTSTSMPSVGTTVMMTKVKANTLYRFSLGFHSGTNVADQFNRMATIELDNNGIYASYIDTGGNVKTVTIWSGTPSTTTTYFLEIVVQKSTFKTPVGVYAYKDDGSGSTPPTYLGSAQFDSGVLWNSYGMYFGTGVWTDSSSNPLSNYQVKEYYNRLRSYT